MDFKHVVNIQQSGNCNVQYITYLNRCNLNTDWMLHNILTNPVDPYYRKKDQPPTFRKPTNAFYFFAQGSDDPVDVNPYGPKLKAAIEHYGLGKVWASDPAPNILHNSRPGIVYVWTVDRETMYEWFKEHVLKPWEEEQRKSRDAAIQAAKTAASAIAAAPVAIPFLAIPAPYELVMNAPEDEDDYEEDEPEDFYEDDYEGEDQ